MQSGEAQPLLPVAAPQPQQQQSCARWTLWGVGKAAIAGTVGAGAGFGLVYLGGVVGLLQATAQLAGYGAAAGAIISEAAIIAKNLLECVPCEAYHRLRARQSQADTATTAQAASTTATGLVVTVDRAPGDGQPPAPR